MEGIEASRVRLVGSHSDANVRRATVLGNASDPTAAAAAASQVGTLLSHILLMMNRSLAGSSLANVYLQSAASTDRWRLSIADSNSSVVRTTSYL